MGQKEFLFDQFSTCFTIERCQKTLLLPTKKGSVMMIKSIIIGDSEFQSEGMAHHVQEPQRRKENDDFKFTSKNLIKLLQLYLLVEVNSRG